MRILLLSDLHIIAYDKFNENKKNEWIRSLLSNIDAVIITGDIFETHKEQNKIFNPYLYLQTIFGEKIPVICSLGNHEFFYNTIEETLNFYKIKAEGYNSNVHYLDIEGHVDIDNVRFVGNVLWYDGSLKTVQNQDIYTWQTGRNSFKWQDCTIKSFDYLTANKDCIRQIDENISPDMVNMLCTHCVPHHRMNAWMLEDRIVGNHMNAYSGCHDLLKERPQIKYIACGHTHKYAVDQIYDMQCYNIGNDLYPPFMHKIITI